MAAGSCQSSVEQGQLGEAQTAASSEKHARNQLRSGQRTLQECLAGRVRGVHSGPGARGTRKLVSDEDLKTGQCQCKSEGDEGNMA